MNSFLQNFTRNSMGTLLHVGQKYLFVVLIFGIGIALADCSKNPEPSPPTPSTQDIRGDSDRFFNKMEKEERSQKSQPE